MKRLLKLCFAIFLAVMMAMLPTVRAFAAEAESSDYISEVKVFYKDPSAAAAERTALRSS